MSFRSVVSTTTAVAWMDLPSKPSCRWNTKWLTRRRGSSQRPRLLLRSPHKSVQLLPLDGTLPCKGARRGSRKKIIHRGNTPSIDELLGELGHLALDRQYFGGSTGSTQHGWRSRLYILNQDSSGFPPKTLDKPNLSKKFLHLCRLTRDW